jgi:hypothetical protein
VPIVLKYGSLNLLEPSGSDKACNGNALPLPAGSAFHQIVGLIILNEVDEFKTLNIYMQNLENNLALVPPLSLCQLHFCVPHLEHDIYERMYHLQFTSKFKDI